MKKSLTNIWRKDLRTHYGFCDGGTNKLCLMLQKGVYPYG